MTHSIVGIFSFAPENKKTPAEEIIYGSGHRHTREQVEAFTVTDKQLLLDYLDAVFARTKSYPASVINCNTRHAGQIEYLRGLVKHGGWFPAAEK